MIHALPGLGADHRMYPGPWNGLPGFAAHDWPSHHGERTLAEMAARVVDEYGITDGDILVGASLGGMVACEISKIRKLEALFLVGSTTSKEKVSRLLACIHPLARGAPLGLIKGCAALIPGELAQMFAAMEISFVRSMCAAIFQWEGVGSTTARTYRLHGRRDWVIRPPARADLLLDGGHLISMTHAEQCAAFLKGVTGI
jgi:pimeloyl-ACP methyl ester carboxylesterase